MPTGGGDKGFSSRQGHQYSFVYFSNSTENRERSRSGRLIRRSVGIRPQWDTFYPIFSSTDGIVGSVNLGRGFVVEILPENEGGGVSQIREAEFAAERIPFRGMRGLQESAREGRMLQSL